MRSMNYSIARKLLKQSAAPIGPRPGDGRGGPPHAASSIERLYAMLPPTVETLRSGGVQVQPTPAAGEVGLQLAYLSRCFVLQAVGAAFITGLWIADIASKPFDGNNAFLCWLILGIGGLGILCLFLQRWKDVEWIATHVVRIGLLGTVIGLIIAFSAVGTGASSDPDEVRKMIAAVVDGMYASLYATLLAIAVNLWLKVNLRLLAGDSHG
jgi:hypothetical protein